MNDRVTVRLGKDRYRDLDALVDDGLYPNNSVAVRTAVDNLVAAFDTGARKQLVTDGSGSIAESLQQQTTRAIAHPNEREAVVLLANAGWTQRELAMTFQCSQGAIRRVIASETGGPDQ